MKELLDVDAFEKFVENTTAIFTAIQTSSDFTSVTQNFAADDQVEARAKLEIGRKWLQDIYSKYYGKVYLIQVGDNVSGICIKDRYGNVPSGNLKVESENTLFYSSDSPSTAGAWLPKNQSSIMGLSVGPELYPFVESDYRIGTFVRYGKQSNISKYDLVWEINFSSFGEDNFYIKGEDVYVKASIDPALYKLGDNQYVKVTVDGGAELRLTKAALLNETCDDLLDSIGARSVLLLYGRAEYEGPLSDSFCGAQDKNGISFLSNNLNVFSSNTPIISPDQFCLPMKSNVFTYGPWFFQANPVGGTEVEVNNELAPWNFSNLQNTGYDAMNFFGSLIASDGPRGLQKQENGSITVAGLPSYSIGYIVGNGASTLTDLVVNISDGGYTSTYNFQTYAPKFGRPGRHLSDLWKNNYKSMLHLNKYFKDQSMEIRSQINNLTKEIQLERNKIAKNRGTTTDPITERPPGSNSANTPHMFLYSAYFLRSKETTNDGGIDDFDNSAGPGPVPCVGCKDPPAPPTYISPSDATSGNNISNMPIAITEETLQTYYHRREINEKVRSSSQGD